MALGLEFDAKRLWAEIQQNRDLLNNCPGPHSFALVGQTQSLRYKEECSKCHGRVDSLWADWYRKGLEDAKKEASPDNHG